MPSIPPEETDGVINALVGLDLGITGALHDQNVLDQKVGAFSLFGLSLNSFLTSDGYGR